MDSNTIVIGQVVSAYPTAGYLRVQVPGQVLTQAQIWVDASLRGYDPDEEVPEGGEPTPILAAGSRVVLVTRDGQSYYLISKVVAGYG